MMGLYEEIEIEIEINLKIKSNIVNIFFFKSVSKDINIYYETDLKTIRQHYI